jgi:antirestriction protein ArdC
MERADLYTRITNRIIAELETGTRPWLQPWNAEHAAGRITRPLRHNGIAYRGINVITLWLTAASRGYACPFWLTYKQAQTLGAQVRKGEQGELVVYANRITKIETGETGEETERAIPFLKGYTVFNAEQIDNLPPHFTVLAAPALDPVARIAHAETFFAHTKADIRHGGDRAYFAISVDRVQMPPFETFRDAEAYYAILAHECTHWTRHETRLHRDFGRKRWGDEGYAAEELVAELGSAFLCADLGLMPEPRADHAAYIASWLRALKNDKRAIFTAAGHAERAAAFLHGLQPKTETPAEPEADADSTRAAA